MAKEHAFKWIAERSAIEFGRSVFSCVEIAKGIGEPLFKVRRYMKELADEGFVVKGYEGGYDELFDRVYCIHGYRITEKGKASSDYIHAANMDEEYWKGRLPMAKT